MKFARTAVLLAASGVILTAAPATAASARTSAGSVPVTCHKLGKGKTTAWVFCHGKGKARLDFTCATYPWGGGTSHFSTPWKKMKRTDTKIVAKCKFKIKSATYSTQR